MGKLAIIGAIGILGVVMVGYGVWEMIKPSEVRVEIVKGEAGQTVRGEEKININNASEEELRSLEGIGEVRARAIIDNRPYQKTEELMSKAKITKTIYEKILPHIGID